MSSNDPKKRSLTTEEIGLLQSFQTVLDNNESAYTVSGVIPSSAVDLSQHGVYYKSTEGPKYLPLPFTDDSAKQLFDASTPAAHGRGGESVYDESYRLARELKVPDFATSFHPLDLTGVLHMIASKLDIQHLLVAKLYKANVYGPDGFFKPHRDTPRGDNHLGTITLCLPSTFTGGELAVRHSKREIVFDWADQVMTPSSSQLAWAFLYSDCEHEVLPVKTGYRVTIAYDVFTEPTPRVLDSRDVPVIDGLSDMLARPTFLPEGGILGFGLSHSYPVSYRWSTDGRILKGIDATLFKQLSQLRKRYPKVNMRWVFAYDLDDEMEDYDDDFPLQETLGNIDHDFKCEAMVSPHQFLLEDVRIEGEWVSSVLAESGASVRRDVIWLAQPGAQGEAGHYIGYGNEPESVAYYVSPCLLVDIPPASERLSTETVVELANKRART